VIDCKPGDKKFEIANRYLARHDGQPSLLLIQVGSGDQQGR
jgi:hypothetical protein